MTKFSPEFLSLANDCLRQFAQTGNDALSSILTPDDLNAFQASYPGFRARDFPPSKTLTLFMSQTQTGQAVNGNKPSNTGTGAYAKARQRLTEESINVLLRTSGNNLDSASPESCLWHQRRVLITDGSTLLMPDTEKNQHEYPQPDTQKKGLVSLFLEFLF